MIHVSEPAAAPGGNKLDKIQSLLQHMVKRCKALYQPRQNVSVDERMVKSKGRSGIRQFIANKPTRFGFKIWCLCDSACGYTYDFR